MPPIRTSLPRLLKLTNLPSNLPALTAAYLLLRNPPNIKEWRVALFLITLEIEMTWEEW